MPRHFPFAAVVGADDLQLALVLTAISPQIGGVLVRGEKGTAKTTTVRALAHVLPEIEVVAGDRFSSAASDPDPRSPDGPFGDSPAVERRPVRLVELPVGATEDRVLGSLHLQRALSAGEVEYEPGLLARAHRGILYVDEINLLHDHLVDLLLDAAATGRSTVERDGVSIEHGASFVLVGTMNPEEGELRPQLLDRFGLTVEVKAPRDPQLRAQIVSRRLAFDADPEGFAADFAGAEVELKARIIRAQELLRQVSLDQATLLQIAEICAAFEVDGMRADIVTARAAAAHAAWHGRTTITREDLAAAARLSLPHRRRRNPFDAPGIDEEELEQLLGEDPEPEPEPPTDPDPEGGPDGGGEAGPDDRPDGDLDPASQTEPQEPGASDPHAGPQDGSREAADLVPPPPVDLGKGAEPTGLEQAAAPSRARLFRVDGLGRGEAGKRSRAITQIGRRIGADASGGGSLALIDTFRAAAPHQVRRGRATGRMLLASDDLRTAVREGRESNLIILCVDASGSMAAQRRMGQVKTAVLSLLLDAYQRRDKVALVTFNGAGAELALPPTWSVDVGKKRLDELRSGGRTPLAEGLELTWQVIDRERIRDPRRRPLLVVVTDGRATAGVDPMGRAARAAGHLAQAGVDSVVIDCETGRFTLGLAGGLAGQLAAQYVRLGEVTAAGLTNTIADHRGKAA